MTDFPIKNFRSAKKITQLMYFKSSGNAMFMVEMYIYRTKKYFVKLYKRSYMFNLLLMHFFFLFSSILCQSDLKSAIKSYYLSISPDFLSQTFCSHFAKLQSCGKFGRVFCKQTSVVACGFQNKCNKGEIALRVVLIWSEIKIVITNRTPALRRFFNHAFNFRPNCTPLTTSYPGHF